MANPDNLTKHRFTSANQPRNRRSRKGIPNRATILKRLLREKVTLPAHLVPGGQQRLGTLEDHIALALIGRAVRGNVPAIREILDSVYGKQTSGVNVNVSAEALQQLSDDELDALMKQVDRGYGRIPMISIIEFKRQSEDRRRQLEELDDDGP